MGRAAVYLIVGMTTIFLYFGTQMHDVKFVAMSNAMKYYENSQRMNIAQSAANFAMSEIFKSSSWTSGFENISFNGGRFIVTTTDTVLKKYGNVKKIFIEGIFQGGVVDEVTGKLLDSVKYITIYMRPSNFSQFAYFSGNDPPEIYWTSKDTVWGPFHSNTSLYINGRPVFNGKVTVKDDVDSISNKGTDIGDPQFNQGFEKGVDIPLPGENDVKILGDSAKVNGKFLETTDTNKKDTVLVTLKGDSVTIQTKYLSGTTTPKTYPITDSIRNGVLAFSGFVVRIKGQLQGKLSVVSLPKTYTGSGGGTFGGNVFIDDDITYKTDPQTNPNSTDMLGIIAEKDIMIAKNAANSTGDIKIQASLFSRTGGFGSEKYDDRPAAGAIQLLGGMVQSVRKAVGTFNSTTQATTSGFSKRYRYDERLKYMSPPGFPDTKMLQIISWYE